MSAMRISVFSIAALCCLVLAAFGGYKSGATQLALLLLTPLFCAAFVAGVVLLYKSRARLSFGAATPLLACVCALPLGLLGAAGVRHALFQFHLPGYERLIARADIRALAPAEKPTFMPLSQEEKKLAYAMQAQRLPDGTLLVELMTEGAFPLKHAGYVYTSTGRIDASSGSSSAWLGAWPRRTEIQPNWFRVAD